MSEIVNDEDWVEVDKVPLDIGKDILDNASFPDKNDHIDLPGTMEKDNCIPIPSSTENTNLCQSDLSLSQPSSSFPDDQLTENSTDPNHNKNFKDSRDITIDLLERRVQALEEGIHFIYSQIHTNPGIRQALKSSLLEKNDNEEDNLSTSIPSYIEELPEDVGYELTDVIESTHKLGAILSKQNQAFPKLSFLNFEVGDIALFMPAFVDNRRVWMAFNSGSPHYYLSQESLQAFLNKNKQREQRTSIIGKLVFMEKKVAVPNNEFLLAEGTEFHLCYAEPLYRHDLPPRPTDKNVRCNKTTKK